MVTFSSVSCPRCQEWRASLITEITDPMGQRYYCCVCACEFRLESFRTTEPISTHAKERDPLRS